MLLAAYSASPPAGAQNAAAGRNSAMKYSGERAVKPRRGAAAPEIPGEKGRFCFNLPNCSGLSARRVECFAHFAFFVCFTLAFLQKKG